MYDQYRKPRHLLHSLTEPQWLPGTEDRESGCVQSAYGFVAFVVCVCVCVCVLCLPPSILDSVRPLLA
jgi:hypothetical protein